MKTTRRNLFKLFALAAPATALANTSTPVAAKAPAPIPEPLVDLGPELPKGPYGPYRTVTVDPEGRVGGPKTWDGRSYA
jgi:hypothetical protein